MPEAIIIYFPKYIGPQFFDDQERINYIPINAKTQYSKIVASTRKQNPIRLAYAITTHKTKGDTLDTGIINVGKNEKNLGSTFVRFSRFKKLTNFIVHPFPFSRLTKIALSKSLAPRLLEETRLEILNVQTKINWKDLIPI